MSEQAAQPAAPAAGGTPAWWQTDWAFILATVVVTLAIAWGMARYELVSRAKKAYLEGAKYEDWMAHPEKKKAAFDAELNAKKITPEEHARLMEDSDLKNAYTWYTTVTDLFQPPRSEWVLKSEERLKEIKPKYQAWLRSLGIDPVE